jgi:hypothetical protein
MPLPESHPANPLADVSPQRAFGGGGGPHTRRCLAATKIPRRINSASGFGSHPPSGARSMCTSGYSAQGWCYALDQAREAFARVSNQYENRHQQ